MKTCILLLLLLANLAAAFEDHHQDEEATNTPQPKHKDKVLLRQLEKLVFYRNKMTTARRTHSIHQLSCVGGTAGCKMFAPTVVECHNAGLLEAGAKIDWRCQADIDERAQLSRVEVICEGYEYAEDDYVLLGSCGLEFALDYRDPHDHHHQSYFAHMDAHEQALHRSRKPPPPSGNTISAEHQYLLVLLAGSLVALLAVVGCWLSTRNKQLAAPATKKAC